jgi:hypothetical protein
MVLVNVLLLFVCLVLLLPLHNEKLDPIRGVASFEGDNSVIFYYLGSSKIWPDKRGTTVYTKYFLLVG